MNSLYRLCGVYPLTLLGALLAFPASAQVSISQAWVRAMPPTQSMTAAYLSVHNGTQQMLRVVGARAEGAGRVEIHQSSERDGMARMQQLEGLVLEPGSTTELRPGGIHLMLLDMARMPAAGETVSLCIELDGADALCTEAPVRRGAEAGAQHHHH